MNKSHMAEIVAYVGNVPAHIQAIAGAIRYDLMYGPTFSRIPKGDVTKFTADDVASLESDLEVSEGDVIEQTYVGKLANTLREYIESLPSTLYITEYTESVTSTEPEGYEDEFKEWQEAEPCTLYDSKAIVEVMLGKTIANEF